MSSKRVVVDAPTGASVPVQRHRASFRGTRSSSSSLDSPPVSRTSAMGGLIRAPRVYVGMASDGYTGGLGGCVTRRALGISSVFLQGLRSSGLATAPAPGLGRDLDAAEDLGGCLVGYMAQVHALEQVSQELEAQLRRHLESKAGRAEHWGALRASWASSCQQVGEAVLENARLVLRTENIQAGADAFKDRYENEQPFRKAAEEEINSLYKVIDEANLTTMDLESQIESLKEELGFLSRSYEEDVKVLCKQLAVSELEQVDVPLGAGLDDVRSHCQGRFGKWQCYSESSRRRPAGQQRLAAARRAELHSTSRQVQSLQAETESLRALKRGLENTLQDAKHWHDLELQNLGAVVRRLEAELREMRAEAEQQQQTREQLLAHRCQLQRDVASYHVLLDREESRIPDTVSKLSLCPHQVLTLTGGRVLWAHLKTPSPQYLHFQTLKANTNKRNLVSSAGSLKEKQTKAEIPNLNTVGGPRKVSHSEARLCLNGHAFPRAWKLFEPLQEGESGLPPLLDRAAHRPPLLCNL
ncbi:Phakinin [Myotis brandtii]|uniref:Phakinin n=1 Tax=Myotis brandtii TaxID=109478 RepID=S7PDW1_MYOBR|nr:Phakinin [Myotis brandtii]